MATCDYGNFLVRIICMTYNHASFIVDALNGFTCQQTDFPYVCIILDDASTDGEPEVVRKYLSDHFDLEDEAIARFEETDDYYLTFARHKTNLNCHFALFLLKYNHYKKKSKVPYYDDWTHKVKYEAVCEGDDYWTDPQKLQKQVDYMEGHPGCSLCFTNAVMHWEDGSGLPDRLFAPNLEERDYRGPELTEEWITPTASLLYRKSILDTDFYRQANVDPKLNGIGDIPHVLSCLHFGQAHALPYVTCTYRRQPGGFMLSADSTTKIAHGDYRYALYQIFGREYLDSSISRAVYHYRLAVHYAKVEHNRTNYIKSVFRIIRVYLTHPICSGKRLARIIRERKERIAAR